MTGEIIPVSNKNSNLNRMTIDRREMLRYGLAGLLASVVPLSFSKPAVSATSSNQARRVVFKNVHTGESFNGVYRVGDKYLPEAFERLNTVLRDHRNGEVFPMDPRVIDILSKVQQKTGKKVPVNILSGYRSPQTNSNLRKASSGVAKNSFHMYGQALDIQIDGVGTRQLRDAAMSIKSGGVGYYPRSSFVHIDTGDIRSW